VAEIFPNEGLDLILGIFPKGSATLGNTFLCLFDSTSTATGASASVAGNSASVANSYVEPSAGAYARQTIASGSWGSQTTTQSGRGVTASQVTFPTATAGWGTIWGFWLANQASASGDTCIFAANFDDTTAITVNTNDIVKVTPTCVYTG
jgi:hypothetical protein